MALVSFLQEWMDKGQVGTLAYAIYLDLEFEFLNNIVP